MSLFSGVWKDTKAAYRLVANEKVKSLIELSIDNPLEARDYKKEIISLHSKFYRELSFMKLLNTLSFL